MEKEAFLKEDESSIYNNINHEKSINSCPKTRIRQKLSNNKLYVNISKDIYNQKNLKQIDNELFNEYMTNLSK